MKARWFPIIGVAMFIALMVALPPTASALEWSIMIQPPEGGPIVPGGTATVSVTGVRDAEIYLEVALTDDPENPLVRIPETGTQTLQNGIWVFTWDVNATILPGQYYLTVREGGVLRTAIAFNLGEDSGDSEIQELKDSLARLETWIRLIDKGLERMEQNMADQLRMLWVTTLIALVLSCVAITGSFADRSPALRALFRGERETKEDKTYKELGKLLQYFVRREVPTEFGDVFRPELPKSEVPKPKAEEQPMFKKNCEYCGDEFEAKSQLAKYCIGKNCRVLAYKKRQREAGGDD